MIYRIENITNFHSWLTFRMVKMFQYFESPRYVILLNAFYFSIFAYMEMLKGINCTWVCPKMCRIEDITNFHGSLALSNSKIARYFRSPYYPILLIAFILHCFHKVLWGYICSCISPEICGIEDITNFHGRLILNNGKFWKPLPSYFVK